MMIEIELEALRDLTESVLLAWLHNENPTAKRRQKALESLSDAGCCLEVACINLGLNHDKE